MKPVKNEPGLDPPSPSHTTARVHVPSSDADPPTAVAVIDRLLATMVFFQRICLVKIGDKGENKLWPALKFDSIGELQDAVKNDMKVPVTNLTRLQTQILFGGRNGSCGIAYLLGKGKVKRSLVQITDEDMVEDFYSHIDDIKDECKGDAEFQQAYTTVMKRSDELDSDGDSMDTRQLAAMAFFKRICLVKIEGKRENKLWPALKFDSIGELQNAVKNDIKVPAADLIRLQAKIFHRGRNGTCGIAYLLGKGEVKRSLVPITNAGMVENFYSHISIHDIEGNDECTAGDAELQKAYAIVHSHEPDSDDDSMDATVVLSSPPSPGVKVKEEDIDSVDTDSPDEAHGSQQNNKRKSKEDGNENKKKNKEDKEQGSTLKPKANTVLAANSGPSKYDEDELISKKIPPTDEPYRVMSNAEAWQLLEAKFGFTSINENYYLLSQEKPIATSIVQLRKDICANGLPDITAPLSEKEKLNIARWVRYAHVRELADGQTTNPDNSKKKSLTDSKELALNPIPANSEAATQDSPPKATKSNLQDQRRKCTAPLKSLPILDRIGDSSVRSMITPGNLRAEAESCTEIGSCKGLDKEISDGKGENCGGEESQVMHNSTAAYETKYASLAKALLDDVVNTSKPSSERAVDIITMLQRESNNKKQPITISILENTKLGIVLIKTVKACKRHDKWSRTSASNVKEDWDMAITIAKALRSNMKKAVRAEQAHAVRQAELIMKLA
eukprot:CAMPEP_0172314850 /NCGR_PEP_ID=MMETSP1058-20130122/23368_1 /TAXON_ID=83371 /ORGANISM="Detonula confervacea, Strain CCMP 353" /LENGTH=728 /DNA_ID=CAMNT_0013028799 /DNA_START=30 /DNA_END=2216 /DNA_ORIENTATION=+